MSLFHCSKRVSCYESSIVDVNELYAAGREIDSQLSHALKKIFFHGVWGWGWVGKERLTSQCVLGVGLGGKGETDIKVCVGGGVGRGRGD